MEALFATLSVIALLYFMHGFLLMLRTMFELSWKGVTGTYPQWVYVRMEYEKRGKRTLKQEVEYKMFQDHVKAYEKETGKKYPQQIIDCYNNIPQQVPCAFTATKLNPKQYAVSQNPHKQSTSFGKNKKQTNGFGKKTTKQKPLGDALYQPIHSERINKKFAQRAVV